MNRRAFPACAGILVLLVALVGLGFERSTRCPQVIAPESPRPIAREAQRGRFTAEIVLASAEDAVEQPADKGSAKPPRPTGFIYSGIEPIAPQGTVAKPLQSLVVKRKTGFVTQGITPAQPPAASAPQASKPAPTTKLTLPTGEPAVRISKSEPAKSAPAKSEPATTRLAPQPRPKSVVVAPAEPVTVPKRDVAPVQPQELATPPQPVHVAAKPQEPAEKPQEAPVPEPKSVVVAPQPAVEKPPVEVARPAPQTIAVAPPQADTSADKKPVAKAQPKTQPEASKKVAKAPARSPAKASDKVSAKSTVKSKAAVPAATAPTPTDKPEASQLAIDSEPKTPAPVAANEPASDSQVTQAPPAAQAPAEQQPAEEKLAEQKPAAAPAAKDVDEPAELNPVTVTPAAPSEVAPEHLASKPDPDELPAATPAVPARMPVADAGRSSQSPAYAKLPFAQPPKRTLEVVAAVKRANEKVTHGYGLAERGALYSARAEFTEALTLIAQAYDAQRIERTYTKALANGLTALQEAGDFIKLTRTLGEVNIASTIIPHTTPVLKDTDVSALSPREAAQAYHSYAQEQLSAATAGEMCGSMALYGMGRVAAIIGKNNGQQMEYNGQAIALYRASLIAEPKNYRAANELGVLLAENGQLELARDLLIRSVSVAPQVTTWKNLAVVHNRSGQQNLAKHAEEQALAMEKSGHGPKKEPSVQWVDPATFATTTAAGDSQPAIAAPKAPANAAGGAADANKPPASMAKKGFAEWLGLGPRR